jgi:hypothetical membrane protein
VHVSLPLPDWMRLFGPAGCLVPAAAALGSSLVYRGRAGERYSPLNHFVSELGERGVSRAAGLFNAGLIAGGILMLPFFFWLGVRIGTIMGTLAAAAGAWAAVSCSLVGVYPMTSLGPHIRAATSFFRGGLAAALLTGLAVLLDPERHSSPWAAAGAGAAVAAYAAFLTIASIRHARRTAGTPAVSYLDPSALVERPRVWVIPAMEWLVFAATVGWFLALGIVAR